MMLGGDIADPAGVDGHARGLGLVDRSSIVVAVGGRDFNVEHSRAVGVQRN